MGWEKNCLEEICNFSIVNPKQTFGAANAN